MSHSIARYRLLVVTALAVFAAACGDSPVEPPRPKSVVQDQPAPVIDGTAGTVLTPPLTFTVKDQSGKPLGGVNVVVTITAGGGTLTDAPAKSASGPTPVGTWTLGTVAGVNTITITVEGLTPLVISVNGKPGAPAAIAAFSGNNQSALAGTPVQVAPVVQVRDKFGNGVPGIAVSFGVVDGGGVISGNSAATDATGKAVAPQWTLGKSAVPQTLSASVNGGIVTTFYAFIQSDYDVDVRFFGPPVPAATAGLFTAAAARIKAAVIGDVYDAAPDAPLDLAEGCGVQGLPTAFQEVIDDVIVYASFGPIDGPGKILGFSFPCGIRGELAGVNNQTAIGVMKFDIDDLNYMVSRGNLSDVIEHEMLHVVGVGTLWRLYGILAGAGTAQSRYTGTLGIGGCIEMGGAAVCPASVPVENEGEAGTRDAHWRDSVFGNELMTGYVNDAASSSSTPLNPLSVMTIESLGDLGYSVNPKAADQYTIPGVAGSRVLGQLNVAPQRVEWEKVMRPKFRMTRSGRITPILPQ